MLALPSPYGYPEGVGIRMFAPHDCALEVAKLAHGHGCPLFIITKVYDCIAASGRYDCRVTLRLAPLMRLERQLHELGGSLEFQDDEGSAVWLNHWINYYKDSPALQDYKRRSQEHADAQDR